MKKKLTIVTVFVIALSMFSPMMPLVKAQTIQWSEPIQLTIDSGCDEYASIMQDSSGKIWLVWGSIDTGDLWYKTSLDGGVSWCTAEILVPDIFIVGGTSLLQDSTGRIWVAWASGQYSPPIDWDIYYVKSDNGGQTWSVPEQLTDYVGDDNIPSLIEVSGEVWLVFRSYGLSYDEDIWYMRTTLGEEHPTWSEPILLTPSLADNYCPDAMVDSTGKIWVVWARAGADIYYKTSTNNGADWSPNKLLTGPPNTEGVPSLIEDVSGKIFVFFARKLATWDVSYITTIDGGDTWSDYQNLTSDASYNTVPCATLINGQVCVTWQSDRSGNTDIWMSGIVPTHATVDIDPDTLNLKSNGQWITCYIELPEGYDVSNIDVNSILLNDTVPVDIEDSITVGDYDMDNIPDLMAKFDRATIIQWLNTLDHSEDTGKYYEINLTVTGTVAGTQISGTDKIKVLKK